MLNIVVCFVARSDEYRWLLERSRRFYESSLMLMDRGFYDLAAFSLEQCLQLYLKGVLLKLGMDYPRTHSIRRLLELFYELTQRREISELSSRLGVELSLLEDAYITTRYVPREFPRDVVERLRTAVDEVLRVVGEVAGGGG